MNKPTEQDLTTFSATVEKEVRDLSDTLIPLLRTYVDDLRNIRMAINAEVRDLLRSMTELREMTKVNDDIERLAVNMDKLRKNLTPEFIDLIRRLNG